MQTQKSPKQPPKEEKPKESSPATQEKKPAIKKDNPYKHQRKEKRKQEPRLSFEQRLALPADHPDKIYKGLFISKIRRKKGDAGRIKAEGFKCRIDVRFSNGALHESQVYWIEHSRRQNKKKEDKVEKAPAKYVQKEGQIQKETKVQQKNQQQKNIVKQTSQQQLTKQLKELKIEDKPLEKKEENLEEENVVRKDNRGRNQKQENQNQQGKQQEVESETQEGEEADYTINAKIIRILSCPHQKRNIVCVINFQRNKYKPSDHKNHLIALEEDYIIDIFPTNVRLERFAVPNLEPLKKYVPKDRKEAFKFFDSHYFSIKYLEWRREDMYPFGKIVAVVSQGFTPEGECQALLQELNLVGYDESKSGAKIDLQITPEHKDYRDLFVFTVDPATAVDLDDALSIEPCEEGFEIGIHIADVTSYSKFFDRQKLCKLSSSAYLPYTAKHMLPEHLVQIITLCAHVDRLAFSVFVTMNKKGEVQKVRYEKTIIHSRAKLAYEHAQRVIDKVDPQFPEYVNEELAKDLSIRITHLNKLAKTRRKQRTVMDLFNNSEIKFQLNEKNYPTDIKKYERQQANKMVEEFMLLGNQLVASKLVEMMPKDAIIIHHPVPSKTNRDFFNKMFEQYGYELNFESMKQLEGNIMDFIERAKDNTLVHELIKMKATRIQELAMYKRVTNDTEGHFALGMQTYTHFTSPMRRFSDIIAAQQLMLCLKSPTKIELSPEQRKTLDFEIQCTNQKRRATKRLKSMILDKFLCLLIRNINSCIETDAIIMSFGLSSVTILVPDYDLQKEIYWRQDLDISRVKNIGGNTEVSFYHQNKLVFWKVKKHQQIKVRIDSTRSLPLDLVLHLLVEIEEKEYVIKAFR